MVMLLASGLFVLPPLPSQRRKNMKQDKGNSHLLSKDGLPGTVLGTTFSHFFFFEEEGGEIVAQIQRKALIGILLELHYHSFMHYSLSFISILHSSYFFCSSLFNAVPNPISFPGGYPLLCD